MSTKLSPEIDRSSTPPQTRSTDLSENRDYFDSDRRGGKYHGSFKDRDTESSRRNEYLIELRNAFEDLRTKFATLDEIHFQKGAEARSHNKKSRSKKQNLLLKPDGYGTPPIVDRQILDFNFIYHEEARTIFMGRLANNLEVWTSISQDSPNPLRYLLGNQGGSKVRETELALVDDSAYPMHAIMEELSLRRDCQYEEVRVLDLETVLLAALCCFQAGWEAGQKSALALWVCEFIQHVVSYRVLDDPAATDKMTAACEHLEKSCPAAAAAAAITTMDAIDAMTGINSTDLSDRAPGAHPRHRRGSRHQASGLGLPR